MNEEGEKDQVSPGDLLERILFPRETLRREEVVRGMRFVHYTSAEVAANIIRGRAVWMRNALTMNDLSEVTHGLKCVARAWEDEIVGRRFRGLLDRLQPGLSAETAKAFSHWQSDLCMNTYLTCLSEHSEEEDQHGRLSMWRAYGGTTGVALVLNTNPFTAITDELKAYSSPVAYLTDEQVTAELQDIADKMEEKLAIFSGVSPEVIASLMFNLLRFTALCTKHPGFAEEREWRIIYQPNMAKSPVIKPAVEVVRGVPQIVQKIPLRNSPSEGLFGAAVPDLIDKVIIGPTRDPWPIYQAFCALLSEAGVDNPEVRVQISGIPLRAG